MSESTSDNNALRVMVLDDQFERVAAVETSLIALGFNVVSVLSSAQGLLHQIGEQRPDVILIDLDSPDRDVLESLAIVNAHNPTPIVMFSGSDDASFIREAIDAGVTAYQGQGLDPDRVKPIIELAMSQFRNFEALRQELAATRSELEDHKTVERAKAALSERHSIGRDEAHRLMQKLSMDRNQRLPDIARTVLAALETGGGIA
ncbi:MAG: ANTAR domain-containing protein [Pseudomonadota bacterium]